MAKLTKADAARQLGIARSTLYKLIDQGKVSPTPDGLIDQAELVRVAAYVDTLKERTRTSADTTEIPALRHAETPYRRPQTAVHEQPWTDTSERPQTSPDVVVDILREQLQLMREELQAVREERQAVREREALLLHMLQQMQQRYDRLLEAPRPASVSPSAPRAPSALETPRGDMRRRIVALLREHPQGLTPAEIRTLLRLDKRLSNTCLGMLRDGLLRRVGRGRYVAHQT
jgi:hypothetical protein